MIRRWCFPGDPRFESSLDSLAISAGLLEPDRRARHLEHVRVLLDRLRQNPGWGELDAAERHHEVPYAAASGGRPMPGYLDLLYRKLAGTWRVVDFKTEPIAGEDELQAVTHGCAGRRVRYDQQVAVQWLNQPVKAALCLLDVGGAGTLVGARLHGLR